MAESKTSKTSQPVESFNKDSFLEKSVYDVEIDSIRTRLDVIESRTKDNTAMVSTIKDVLSDRNIDPIMSEYMNNHVDLSPSIEKAVEKLDKRWIGAKLKSIWGFVVAILLLIAGALIKKYLIP